MNAPSASGHARCALNRGMVRASVAHFAEPRCGPLRSGALRGRDRWCVQATLRRALPAPGRRDQPRRRATSSASGGFDRSRPDRIGRPSAVPPTCGHGTPTAGSSHAKPSSSLPSNSFVTRYSSSSGSTARKPCATPTGIVTLSSGLELAGLHEGRRPAAVQQRPDVDERDERAPVGDDPVVDLAAVEVEAAQHAGGGGREVGLDERLGQPAAAPQLAEAASLVGMALDRAVGDAGDRRPGHRAGRLPPAAVSRSNSGA